MSSLPRSPCASPAAPTGQTRRSDERSVAAVPPYWEFAGQTLLQSAQSCPDLRKSEASPCLALLASPVGEKIIRNMHSPTPSSQSSQVLAYPIVNFGGRNRQPLITFQVRHEIIHLGLIQSAFNHHQPHHAPDPIEIAVLGGQPEVQVRGYRRDQRVSGGRLR